MNSAIRLALIATVAATAFTAWKESQQTAAETPPANARTQARAERAAEPSAPAGEGIRLQGSNDLAPAPVVDLFGARQWLKAPPPPGAAACDKAKAKTKGGRPCPPPEPASAPALPFAFSGLWVEGAIRYVVLTAGGQQYLLCTQCSTPGSMKAGDTLLGQYRLESLDANQAVFTYLPLMQRQSLMLESL